MLVDTDVLIWYLKGNKKASAVLGGLGQFSISAVTYMEILQGIRNRMELNAWKSFLKNRDIRQILLDHEITTKAMYWMEEFFLSHQLRMADALIAATTDVYGLELLTGNDADYKFLPGLTIKTFKVFV